MPLNAGNVLGAEDSRPISKWESIIRRTLNKNSSQPKMAYKSYSNPSSPVSRTSLPNNSLANETNALDKHAFERTDQDSVMDFGKNFRQKRISSISCANKFDWPEYSLDASHQTLPSGGRYLRRVLSTGRGTGFGWLEESKVCSNAGLKRAYHSLGNLGMLWSEQQEVSDVLEDISEKSSEGDPSSESGERSKSHPRFVRIVSKQMVGIYISVWVCRRLRRHINNLKVSLVGVGLMGYMGNKVIALPSNCICKALN